MLYFLNNNNKIIINYKNHAINKTLYKTFKYKKILNIQKF